MAQKKDNSNAEDVSILSSGIKIEGKLYSEGNVRLDGQMVGELTVNGNLTLGDSSNVKGNVKARNVTICGKVEGTVQVADKLILESGSKLTGDLVSKILVIEEGAIFEGNSSMGQKAKE
ncbi:MAG: polymer-forming cytoskeletal protein [Bacteroidetes bacterium]|nr:polymer-forming cytoskeletal protein [Bacteroidota bacterium]MBU1679374.1 polymer-forming cytoskeletal protein [Bacteroidota bacterium]